jgi:hypothetical protein
VRQLQVTATFGPPTPPEVAEATALVAASISQIGAADPSGYASGAGQLDADDEGNAVTITEGAPVNEDGAVVPPRSTGVARADLLLQPLVRVRVRIS